MKIDIYCSKNNSEKFLSVPSGTDVSKLKLQDDFDNDLIEVNLFKKEAEIILGESYIALDAVDLARQIKEKGYAIHFARIESSIQMP